MAAMPTRPADPLHATDWLLVDGNNLLHALSQSTTPAPRSALIGRLRGAVPASIAIDVVFDGPASPGLIGERIAPGLRVRYGGRRSADAVLLSLADEVRTADGPAATGAILVVTDDADLRHRLRAKGARTAGTAWLLGRLARAAGPSGGSSGTASRAAARSAGAGGHSGASKTPANAPAGGALDVDEDAPRWEPGRRATVKKGNPYRRRRSATDGHA
jgi:YacP-like NYN domain